VLAHNLDTGSLVLIVREVTLLRVRRPIVRPLVQLSLGALFPLVEDKRATVFFFAGMEFATIPGVRIHTMVKVAAVRTTAREGELLTVMASLLITLKLPIGIRIGRGSGARSFGIGRGRGARSIGIGRGRGARSIAVMASLLITLQLQIGMGIDRGRGARSIGIGRGRGARSFGIA